MSKYYSPKKTRGIFNLSSKEPFRISRSKIDLFLSCPRCFYLDRRMGISRPPGFPFNLNTAVDTLLKKEFDIHRVKQTAHPLVEKYGVDAIPFQHEKMDEWRDNWKGVQYLHEPTNFLVTGAIDDVWINPNKEIIVVDYKATSKQKEVSLDAPWQITYKRQVEIYQWLLRKNGFKVSNVAYFVYCNGRTDKEAFDQKIEFRIKLIPYEGNSDWIDNVLEKIHNCLIGEDIPEMDADCDYCRYRKELAKTESWSE